MKTINTAASLCAASSKSTKNGTRHRTTANIMLQKESAALPCIIMNLMCEWVKYFNINLYVPTYTYCTRQWKLHLKRLHFVYFSTHTFVCPSHFAPSLLFVFFFSSSPPQPLQQWNRVTRGALFIIVYLERTCFIRQAVLLCPIDPKVSVSWIMVQGDGRKGAAETQRQKSLSSVSNAN